MTINEAQINTRFLNNSKSNDKNIKIKIILFYFNFFKYLFAYTACEDFG